MTYTKTRERKEGNLNFRVTAAELDAITRAASEKGITNTDLCLTAIRRFLDIKDDNVSRQEFEELLHRLDAIEKRLSP